MERIEDLKRLVLDKYDKEGIKALTYKRKIRTFFRTLWLMIYCRFFWKSKK